MNQSQNDHLTDGQLRSGVDNELSGEDRLHLETCSVCQERMESLRASSERMHAHLAFLDPLQQPLLPGADPRSALAQFWKQHNRKENPFMKAKNIFSSRLAWSAAALVLVLALLLGVPSLRAFAGQFLNLFRVQTVTILPIDPAGLAQLSGNETLGRQISQVLADSVVTDKQGAAPQPVASAAEASQQAGFNVRLPSSALFTQLYVDSGMGFHFTVNRSRAQAILDEAGRKDLVLPKSVDGANIAVNIPASLEAAYGICPTQGKSAGDPDVAGSVGRNYPDCVMLMEMPSPTISAPPDVNVGQLAQLGLQFTGMSAADAAQFSSTVDWTSSLVIPLPKNAATYKTVSVDGVDGYLIQRPVDDAPQYALIWVKNGIIYVIGSLGNNTQQAIDMANSMK